MSGKEGDLGRHGSIRNIGSGPPQQASSPEPEPHMKLASDPHPFDRESSTSCWLPSGQALKSLCTHRRAANEVTIRTKPQVCPRAHARVAGTRSGEKWRAAPQKTEGRGDGRGGLSPRTAGRTRAHNEICAAALGGAAAGLQEGGPAPPGTNVGVSSTGPPRSVDGGGARGRAPSPVAWNISCAEEGARGTDAELREGPEPRSAAAPTPHPRPWLR